MSWNSMEWTTVAAQTPAANVSILRFPVDITDRSSPFWMMDKTSITYTLTDASMHGDNGMPNADGQSLLYEIEDQHFSHPEDKQSQLPLATVVTSNYQRHFLFASQDINADCAAKLERLSNEPGWSSDEAIDIDWLNSALPSQLDALCELQRMRNGPVFERLKESGDDPAIARPVDFNIDGPEADLKKVASELRKQGLEQATINVMDGDPNSLLVQVVTDTQPDSISAIERKILSATLDTSAKYDGWGTYAEAGQPEEKVGFLNKLKNIFTG